MNMWKQLLCVTLTFVWSVNVATCYSVNSRKQEGISRRSVFFVPALLIAPSAANALDMDAFMQKELDSTPCNDKIDKKCKPKFSDDEALCRFGQPSPETGAACTRAGMPTDRPGRPVDAFGKVDRGDYVRCKSYYVDGENGKLEKKWKCQ
jgi:hypothetical protein